MLAVDDAIFDRLNGSMALLELLATFDGAPAIFTTGRIPDGFEPGDHGWIVVPAPVGDIGGEFDTKNSTGRQWMRDIGSYVRARGRDTTRVEQIAELVRGLFHRQHGAITISGFGVMSASAAGPIVAPSDNTVDGRIVTVTLTATA